MQSKIKVGVFFGGISPEHEVSLSSADGIITNINRSKFKVVEFFIDKKGAFWTGKKVLRDVKNKKFKNLKKADFNDISRKVDIAFPVLHGKGGEDGSIQGFFQTLGSTRS